MKRTVSEKSSEGQRTKTQSMIERERAGREERDEIFSSEANRGAIITASQKRGQSGPERNETAQSAKGGELTIGSVKRGHVSTQGAHPGKMHLKHDTRLKGKNKQNKTHRVT